MKIDIGSLPDEFLVLDIEKDLEGEDGFKETHLAELRLMLKSTGWAVLTDLINNHRFHLADTGLDPDLDSGLDCGIILSKQMEKIGFAKGMLFVLAIPQNILDAQQVEKDAEAEERQTDSE